MEKVAQKTQQSLERRVDQLEKLVTILVQQKDEEEDWIDDPRIVAKLDELADKGPNIPEDKVKFWRAQDFL